MGVQSHLKYCRLSTLLIAIILAFDPVQPFFCCFIDWQFVDYSIRVLKKFVFNASLSFSFSLRQFKFKNIVFDTAE